MSLARVKVWIPGDVLTAADLNGEFNNVLNNPITLISPTTGPINFNSQANTNFVLQNAATTPTPATAGLVYFNTALKAIQVDDGTSIRTIIGTPSTAGTPGTNVFNIKTYGALGDGINNDTTAVQAAVNAAIAAGGGVVYAPKGTYLINQVNLTSASNCTILGDGWNVSKFQPSSSFTYSSSGGHVFDCTGALNITFRGFQVGSFNQGASPQTAFFLAQTSSAPSNAFHFDGTYVTGSYEQATLYVYGVPSWDAINADWYNYRSSAGNRPVLVLTNSNTFGLTSTNAVISTSTAMSCSDITFVGCEFHKFAGLGANNGVVLLDGATDIRFNGGNITGGAASYVVVTGVCKRILFSGPTFETESEVVTPTQTIGIAGTLTGLSMNQCVSTAGSFIAGAGAITAREGNTNTFIFNITAGGTVAAASTTYLGPAGNDATEGNSRLPVPYTGILQTLNAAAGGSPGATSSESFQYMLFVNGAASTTLIATTTGGNTVSANTTGWANVSSGDVVSVRLIVSTGANTVGGHRATIGFLAAPQMVI
jgi:hypothetical protein